LYGGSLSSIAYNPAGFVPDGYRDTLTTQPAAPEMPGPHSTGGLMVFYSNEDKFSTCSLTAIHLMSEAAAHLAASGVRRLNAERSADNGLRLDGAAQRARVRTHHLDEPTTDFDTTKAVTPSLYPALVSTREICWAPLDGGVLYLVKTHTRSVSQPHRSSTTQSCRLRSRS